jgi:3-deoxy-D-manno-octulosonic-acid transferase
MGLERASPSAAPPKGIPVWWLYRCLVFLLSPLWLLVLAVKQRGQARLRERLGFAPKRDDAPIWIQAVSVGEVRIAIRLAARLKELGFPSAITSTTAAGLDLAQREGPAGLTPSALPLDLPSCARRALASLDPRALVLVETEVWPALFREARSRGVPVFIVNGRLSDRALKRTLRFRGLFERSLRDARVAAQSEEHAARFKLLGATPGHMHVLGNLKYDLVPPPHFQGARRELAALLTDGPLWVAGSVREGEEDLVLRAHEEVRRAVPAARLVLAPRHLNRAALCLDLARARGLTAALRSQSPGRDWDVLVLDTVGELWSAYDLSAAAFVGGSLVPLGGQNVLEPAFLGKPVLYGPHTENFREETERLSASGGGFRVENAAELGWRIASFLSDPELARGCGQRALLSVERHRGAVDRVARWVSDALPAP